jgi:uncharacterized protein YfaT (DUF1175 family)
MLTRLSADVAAKLHDTVLLMTRGHIEFDMPRNIDIVDQLRLARQALAHQESLDTFVDLIDAAIREIELLRKGLAFEKRINQGLHD